MLPHRTQEDSRKTQQHLPMKKWKPAVDFHKDISEEKPPEKEQHARPNKSSTFIYDLILWTLACMYIPLIEMVQRIEMTDLCEVVVIEMGRVSVYPNKSNDLELGKGMNVSAKVSMENIHLHLVPISSISPRC